MSEQRSTGRPKGEPTQQVAFRFFPALLARLDAYATDLNEQHRGAGINRTDAVRILLEQALDEAERSTKPTRRKKAPPRVTQADRTRFINAYVAVGSGRGFVRIHRLREHLTDWSRPRFDRTLTTLRAEHAIELHGGDTSTMTTQEQDKSYTDEHGTLYVTLSWRDET